MKKNDPLLMEIQDEISRENMVRFVNKYGKVMVIAAVIFFLALASYQFWTQYRKQEASVAGSKIMVVMRDRDMGKPQDEFALKKLDETSKSPNFYEISLLNKAQIQIKNNDVKGAIASFDAVAKNGDDKALKDLAAINAANLLLNTNPKADGLEKRLTELTGDNASFKYNARELLAAYYLQNNNNQKATEVLSGLAKDASVPVTISKRARELLAGISTDNGNEPDEEE